jgi:hypothetical protein
VFRGLAGYGAHSRVHTAKILTDGIVFWESTGWIYQCDINYLSDVICIFEIAYSKTAGEYTMISVNTIDSTNFEVIVEGNTTTTHRVTVTHSYYQKLTNNRVTPEMLVETSFKFLLERESNTSILSRFDLPIIERYFPEYEETIKTMLK